MLSIIIPTYEQHGFGGGHLMQCLHSIVMQDYPEPFEILISDNSETPAIRTIVEIFRGQLADQGITDVTKSSKDEDYRRGKKLIIVNYVFSQHKGPAINTNYALGIAMGDIIKPMFMDDAFAAPDALRKFVDCLNCSQWCFSDSIWKDEFFNQEKPFEARMDVPMLMAGANTIGMPSVIAFRKTDLRFDTSLRTLFDVEFYLQLYKQYGAPGMIDEPLIVQRIHPHSLSSMQTPRFKEEAACIREKFKL
jgi:glycosyltransferase involved in cell wall biosynthesis